MLKAIVSYSKKIPVPASEYSSQGYSLSLETEISESDPGAIQARLSQTFQLVKSSVEHELANGNGNAQVVKPPETGTQPEFRPGATGVQRTVAVVPPHLCFRHPHGAWPGSHHRVDAAHPHRIGGAPAGQ